MSVLFGESGRLLIQRGQQSGQIRPGEPKALALAFWGAIQGIVELLTWFPGSPVPDHSCVTDILRRP